MGIRPWSPDEDRLLRANYPSHGSTWEGWRRLLPDRTESSIRNRAQRLDIFRDQYATTASDDADERVIQLFHAGWPCSRIDGVLGLPEGRAHRVVVGSWADETEQRHE